MLVYHTIRNTLLYVIIIQHQLQQQQTRNITSINLRHNKYKTILMIIVIMVKYNEKLLKKNQYLLYPVKNYIYTHIDGIILRMKKRK